MIQISKIPLSDLALEPLVNKIGYGEEVSANAGGQECFDFMRENISTCVKEHRCGKDGNLPLLPDRVIWIEAKNGSGIQLIEPKNIRAKYLALSYCWGPVSPSTYLTDMSTFSARK